MLETERVPKADGRLRNMRRPRFSGNGRELSDRRKEFLTRLILPAVARGERELRADIVVLHLNEELHIRREVHTQISGDEVNVHEPRRQIDIGVDVARRDLDETIRSVIRCKVDLE